MKYLRRFWENLKRQFNLRLVWKLRWYIFRERLRKFLSLFYASLYYICLLGLLAWTFDSFVIPFFDYMKDPSIATLIGAIVGALVGGMFAYTAAVDVHKMELKAIAALKSRDNVYRPLLSEFGKLRFTFRDPLENIFTNTYALDHLPFSETLHNWLLSNYQDIKLSQIPMALGKAVDKLTDTMHAGEKAEKAILSDKEFRRLLKTTKDLSKKYDKDEENYEIYWKRDEIWYEVEQLESFQNLEKILAEFRSGLDEVIEYLEELIKHINNQFQQNANWY